MNLSPNSIMSLEYNPIRNMESKRGFCLGFDLRTLWNSADVSSEKEFVND
jgi:hypothetical protein